MREYVIHTWARPRGSTGQFLLEIKVVEARDMVTAEHSFRNLYETFGFSIVESAFSRAAVGA